MIVPANPVGVDAERGESAGGLLAAGAREVTVAVDVGQVDQLFAPRQGLFGFDFGTESGFRGARVAFEHMNGLVAEGNSASDAADRSAGDEPGQRTPEMAGPQLPGLAVDVWDAVEPPPRLWQ
jgi:hypothetical protein